MNSFILGGHNFIILKNVKLYYYSFYECDNCKCCYLKSIYGSYPDRVKLNKDIYGFDKLDNLLTCDEMMIKNIIK